MGVFDSLTWEDVCAPWEDHFAAARIIVCDANLPVPTLARLARFCTDHAVPLWVEPTSEAKCVRMIAADMCDHVAVVSPNLSELRILASTLRGDSFDALASSESTSGDLIAATQADIGMACA